MGRNPLSDGIRKYAMRIIMKLFAANAMFCGGGGDIRQEINIGKHVLIGNNCYIYKGVTIADGCVVASNSVVKSSLLESSTLYAGVPAKAICKIENWTN